ncbi:hypothetical protein FDECE_18485 [Fusarium decemcellulare]|nr:hypothetical protein FDECE_18485 [Fusarium decemcellulare]
MAKQVQDAVSTYFERESKVPTCPSSTVFHLFSARPLHIVPQSVHRPWAALSSGKLVPSPKKITVRTAPWLDGERRSPLSAGALNLTPAPTLSQARQSTPTTHISHAQDRASERERGHRARPPSLGSPPANTSLCTADAARERRQRRLFLRGNQCTRRALFGSKADRRRRRLIVVVVVIVIVIWARPSQACLSAAASASASAGEAAGSTVIRFLIGPVVHNLSPHRQAG